MQLKDVVLFANAVKSLLDANATGVKAYNAVLGGTWETLVFVPQIAAVNGMSGTVTLRNLSIGDTKLQKGYMLSERSIMDDLEFKIGVCRKAATITDSVASFGIGVFRDCITRADISGFHLAYESMILRIGAGGNTAALAAVGFSGGDITSITAAHDLAWDLSTVKIGLRTEIHSLTVGNRALVDTLLETCAMVIGSIRAYASKNNNADLKKSATAVALLGTVAPKGPAHPVNRTILPNQSINWLKNPVARDLNQFTLMTAGGSATIGLVPTVTSPIVGGTPLVYNTMLAVKKAGIPGSGNIIKITNTCGKKIRVKVFRVKGA